MQISGLKQNTFSMFGRSIAIAMFALCSIASSFGQSASTPTTINVSDTAKLTNAKRLGLVLGNEDFYDSGQFMRNLAFRDAGFEGEIWQSTLHCQTVTATSCTDDNLYTSWPANFLANAQAEFIVGAATGTVTTVKSSTAAVMGVTGITVNFASLPVAPAVGDYLVVRMSVPGNAQAGWWTQGTAGTAFTTEYNDLSPNTPGKQALRVTQSTSDQASVTSYMDSVPGRSFLQLNGSYTLFFRAKGTGGGNQLTITFGRALTNAPSLNYFTKTITLSSGWQDYSYTFTPQDTGQIGTLALKFALVGSSMLIDDVSLTAAADANNPTAYRNEVVSTLQKLKPGILRFMDSGTNWGTTIDNLLQPDFARQRVGYSNFSSESDSIPLGLHDYLVLCQTIGAEPWFTMPTGMTTQEVSDLMDYFGGSTSTVYGARRAALGQTAPWSTVFSKIHLEFGNEVWNTTNPGANMTDPLAYGKRAGVIFTTAKSSPSYNSKIFDLIQDGFAVSPWWTSQGLSTSTNYDTVDVAPYTFNSLNDTSSTEAIYGPMFAEPELNDSTSNGQTTLVAQAAAAANPPARVSVYEMNMGTNQGSAAQAIVNTTAASAGAGVTVVDHALLMMRDLGITDQNIFALPGLNAPFVGTAAGSATTTPIWGIVVDMGGLTNLQRPMFLTQQMANSAILPTLLSTSQTGLNPTWNQAYTTNDNFSLAGAHYIQSFAFTDGNKLNIILLNLSRTTALPVNFAGLNTPLGSATISTLASPSIDATNETAANVTIKSTTQTLTASSTLTLPAYSMTVVSVDAPVVPILISKVTDTCANASLSPNGKTTCAATVVGQGKYNPNVTWSVDNGTIDANGNYVAPASLPASGAATITATSAQDTTKTASYKVVLANNSITSVTASCAALTIGQGKQVACTAKVNGTGGFSPAYTWTTTGGSISANGTLIAPLTGVSVTVKATSNQDETKSASVTLLVFPVLNLTTPQISTTSTSVTVSWALNMAANSGISYGTTPSVGTTAGSLGSTTTNPVITIPGLIPNTKYYFVAYSYINGQTVSQTLSATTTNASSVTGVAVTCAATSLAPSGATTCGATVSGSGSYSSTVNWSTSAGTISSGGVLTAPTSGTSVTVTATSTQDATKSASTTIALSSGLVINNPVATTTDTTATVSWSVNVAANNGISYGITPAVGTTTPSLATLTNSPSITITGLTPNTTYYMVIYSYLNSQTVAKTLSVTTASAAATVTGVSVKCSASSVAAGGTTTCTPSVTGTGSYSSAVTWVASAGTISSAGVLTAPTTGTSVAIRAISAQNTTISGVTTVAITPTITAVSVSCSPSSVTAGATTTCTPTVTGTGSYSSAVTWVASAGTISSAGVLTTPTTGTSVAIRAVSTQDATISGVATVTITPAITAVSVSCSPGSVTAGATATCTPKVTGTGSYSSAVTWSASAGSISSTGVLTAPTTGTSVTITATSTQDVTKSSSTTLAVTSAITAVSVSCSPTSVAVGATVTCIPTVTGTGSYSSALTWATSAGSISSTGVLTAPTTGTSVTVTATSTQDATKSASTTITLNQTLLMSNPVVTVTSTTATISWSLNLSANNGISYGLTSSVGTTTPVAAMSSNPTMTLTGLTPNTTYYLVVYSYVNNLSAQKILTLATKPSGTVAQVSVKCASSNVTYGDTTACTPTVTGTGSYSSAVTWSISAGSISSTGVLTAPTTGTSVTVTATSTQDATKFASTTLAVAPTLPLAITSPTFSATPTTIVLHWKVTQPSHSGVDYGTTYSYGGTTPWDNNLSTSPTYTLTGLKPGTTYYLLDVSISKSGEVVYSPLTVKTPLQ